MTTAPRRPPGLARNILVYVILLLGVMAVFARVSGSATAPESIALSELPERISSGTVRGMTVMPDQREVLVELEDGKELTTRKEAAHALVPTLLELGVTTKQLAGIQVENREQSPWQRIGTVLLQLAPILLFGALLLFLFRQTQGGTNQAISFGRSRARLTSGDTPTVTFADVAGVDEAKQELQEIVEFLSEPDKFIALGARIPKGVLMLGPPGCGKTLMARAVAGEAGTPFFSISGSEFVEMFVGVGASRVRDLFEQAKRNSPCIVFVDEIDAVGRQRELVVAHRQRVVAQRAGGVESDAGTLHVAAVGAAGPQHRLRLRHRLGLGLGPMREGRSWVVVDREHRAAERFEPARREQRRRAVAAVHGHAQAAAPCGFHVEGGGQHLEVVRDGVLLGDAGADAIPRGLLVLALVDDVEQFLRLRRIQVQAVAAHELERVPGRRIVAAGDGHAALRAEPADGKLERGRRRDAEIDYLAAGREQPRDDRRLDHRPRRARVAAHQDAARVEICPEGLGKRDDEFGCQGFADNAADAADADLERTHDGLILLQAPT